MPKIINYLGIDWGEKRIGLATGDSEVRLALPLKTVSNLSEILSTIKEEQTDVVVLGQPLKMSGAEASNPLWLSFYKQLQTRTACPVELIDERLTSRAADALEGSEADKASRDEIAASLLLQHYLDRA